MFLRDLCSQLYLEIFRIYVKNLSTFAMSTYVVVRHKGFLIIASIDRLETFSESSTKPSSKVIWGLGFYQHKNDVKVSLQTRRLNFFFCKYRREQHGANLDNLENLQFKLFATLADCFPYDRRANVKMHVVVLQCTSKQTFGFVFKILFWIAFAVLLFKWNSITPWSQIFRLRLSNQQMHCPVLTFFSVSLPIVH